MKNKYIILSVIAALLGFSIYSIYVINKPQSLIIQGEVEAKEIKIGSKIAGRIDSLPIQKGDFVDINTLLYTINSPEIDAKLNQAEAAKEAAQAQEDKANNGAQIEDIQAAYNVWQKAKAAYTLASKTFKRVDNLFKSGVLPEQKKDEAETQMIAALETEKSAKAVYDKAVKGARTEDKKTAKAMVKKAEGVMEEVNSFLSETAIYSPIAGQIANIIAEQGEIVPAGYPVVSVIDLSKTWITFQIKEDMLSKIHIGKEFEASFPALGKNNIKLKITYIQVMGEFANWSATKTSGDFDIRTFEVRAVPVNKVNNLLPGMSALVDWSQFEK